ncbi:putative noranthrone monooxygenase-like protein [Rosellinia necatrix]|uniref:Putative noranthrone monooxygenase-like protein n=1 Tax=Rosellinia necatrix TaxID=77044 RepID=A0A1W2TTJ3_ROSNE|nr:putative noranthrone monooxygenase-like protein [Rosellinia necatrix]
MPFLSTSTTLSATGSIVSSAWISGSIAALSLSAIPAILQSGAPADGLARAWHTQFTRALYIPTTAVAAALNYLYLAQRHRAAGLEWRGYAAGAVADLLLVPFTLAFIGGINSALIASLPGAQARKVLGLDATRALIGRWGNLNVFRIFMPLTGAALGLWNLLRE